MSLMSIENRSPLPAKGLASCLLGLVLSSFLWLALVIYFAFHNVARLPKNWEEPEFWFPLLLQIICGCYLLYRFLRKPNEQPSSRVLLACDWFSVLAVTAFIIAVSRWFILFRDETFFPVVVPLVFFLFATLISLPVMLIRKTELQQRLMRLLPNGVLMLLVALVLSGSIGTLTILAMQPPEPMFMGRESPIPPG